jgi:hypothetical protein
MGIAVDDATLPTLGVNEIPEEIAVPKVDHWGVDGNQTYGDCTVAGVGHATLAWNARWNLRLPTMDSEQLVDTYFELTGGKDTGLVEANLVADWEASSKYFKYELAQGTRVGRGELWATTLKYGVAYLGVALPQSAETQFAQDQPWTPVGGPIAGGHCIVAVGKEGTDTLCVSWGKVVRVTAEWMAQYLMEVWALEPPGINR